MPITGFFVDRSDPGVEDQIYARVRGVNATLYSEGDACLIGASPAATSGLIIQAASQTAQPVYVFKAMIAASSYLRPAVFNTPTVSEFCELITLGPTIVAATQFTAATFDGTACNANASTTTVIFSDGGGGAANNFTGGQVYINELGQQATITADAYGSPNHTLTVAPAFSSAPTTGNTLRIVPWGPGYIGGVRLQTPNPQQGIDVTVAGKTTGHLIIYDVDLSKRIAYVKFSQINP